MEKELRVHELRDHGWPPELRDRGQEFANLANEYEQYPPFFTEYGFGQKGKDLYAGKMKDVSPLLLSPPPNKARALCFCDTEKRSYYPHSLPPCRYIEFIRGDECGKCVQYLRM